MVLDTTNPEDAPATTNDWGTFAIVSAVLMVTQLGFFFTAAALPLYLHDLGAAQNRIGLEVGLGNFAALGLTLVLGPALNRFGGRVFLMAGGILYLCAALGMFLARQEVAVAGLRAIQGIGSAALMPSAFTLGAELLPDRKATALGLMGAANNLSLAFGPPLGLTLYGQYGAEGLFIPAAVAAALGVASTALVPRSPRTQKPAPGFGFDRHWVPNLVANVLQAAYFGGILAYLPLELARLHGPNAGLFFTADAVGVLLLRIPTGMLVDRMGSRLPKLLGLAFTLPGIAVLAIHPSALTLIVSGASTGVGAGLIITGILADLSHMSSEGNRGTAMSLGAASFSAGIFAGSAISGLLIDPGGFNAVLLFGGITCLCALPFAWKRTDREHWDVAGP